MEDGVPADRKAEARSIVVAALAEIDWGDGERWVKINPLSSGETARDIAIIAQGRPDAFILAKLEDPGQVSTIAEMVRDAESTHRLPPEGIALVASIERIRALDQVEAIARCHPRLTALQFGATDMSYEYGYRLDRTGQSLETLYARSRCVLAARLAGIDAGDGPYWFHQDRFGTLRSALWSFQLGFTHKACHSAEQVPIVHEAFEMMKDPQADWAARYLAEAHPLSQR